MSARTDSYPITASEVHFERMRGCAQVHPTVAREALRSDLLVFGLCPDIKWRRVRLIEAKRASYTAPTTFRIVFADDAALPPHYSRTFNKNGILLMEVPNAR